MNLLNPLSVTFVVLVWVGLAQGYPQYGFQERYPVALGVEEMAALGAYPHDDEGSDELAYELRRNALRKRSDQSHFERYNRRQELTNLYGKIAKEFPFLVKQGLLRPGDRKVSIDDLLSMTVFGQPKMGKK